MCCAKLFVEFHICLLARVFVTPKSILTELLRSFRDKGRTEKNLSPLTCVFPDEVKQGDILFLFQLSYCKQVSFL